MNRDRLRVREVLRKVSPRNDSTCMRRGRADGVKDVELLVGVSA
jgi:hypothetical protein